MSYYAYGSDPDYNIPSMVCPATGDPHHPLYQFPLTDKLYVYLLQCDCIFGGIYFEGSVEWLEHPDSGIKAPYIHEDRLLYGRADLIAVGMVQRLEAKVKQLEESLKTTDSLHAAVTDRLDQEINGLKKENGELKRSLNESNIRLATLERGLAALQNQSVSPVQGQRVLVSQQQIPWPTNVTQKSTGHSSNP
jgi:hypothetical protein